MWKQRNNLEKDERMIKYAIANHPLAVKRGSERESKEAFVIHLGVLLILEEFSQPVVVITSVLR